MTGQPAGGNGDGNGHGAGRGPGHGDGTFNFCAGPATLPRAVAERVRAELAAHRWDGASVVEISHKGRRFTDLLAETEQRFRQLCELPDGYRLLFVHGGARMQCSAVPLNLLSRSPSRTAGYVESGLFAQQARREGARFGRAVTVASSAGTGFDRIPEVDGRRVPGDAAYVHLTSNNTVYGTRWTRFPEVGAPLVVDATSDILSRRLDFSRFGLLYAGFQKNLGPAGTALVAVREELLGQPLPHTPRLLDYTSLASTRSLDNTPNTFALFVLSLVLEWIAEQGGLGPVEKANEEKAATLYRELDASGFYLPTALPEHRSVTNIVFRLAEESRTAGFLEQAAANGLLGLAGHRVTGGVRASVYNGMPQEGVSALAGFLREFERSYG